ncbi:hypothetical protein GCM10022209_02790 [Chitinophaga oryziterrae]
MSKNIPFIARNSNRDYDFKVDQSSGVEMGFFAEIKKGKRFALQPELAVAVQTIILNSNDDMAGLEWTNISVAVPLLFKYRYVGLGVLVGPEIAFLPLSDKKGTGAFQDLVFPKNNTEDFQTLSFAGIIGAEYTLGRPGIGLHIRYKMGFTSVWNENEHPLGAAPYDYDKSKQNSLQIGLHWRFGRDKTRIKRTV